MATAAPSLCKTSKNTKATYVQEKYQEVVVVFVLDRCTFNVRLSGRLNRKTTQ